MKTEHSDIEILAMSDERIMLEAFLEGDTPAMIRQRAVDRLRRAVAEVDRRRAIRGNMSDELPPVEAPEKL